MPWVDNMAVIIATETARRKSDEQSIEGLVDTIQGHITVEGALRFSQREVSVQSGAFQTLDAEKGDQELR
ncbi:uncharacterized protein FOMMEDRAFT_152975 [Fomitiporia mediterranea MF3/22]|uniref:uncharacterized protein n=1 Tax=Fomitiporia mediterranea (strain MF3/22) TaxID=694068 RepID=UPI0004407D37|nr:uncharacterized protein FOMMEDRAFT_152975 [Fomitiporia mediterranea MF3/22]EJD05644.1 hypothetical protein FOMMEDRAFT_152975 [Fomitiporia mediterranea MF3/22]